MIDGRNLDLEKGTGVATYARNLSYCLRDMGYRVDVLYGKRSAPSMTDIMKEISFFDINVAPVSVVRRLAQATLNIFQATFGYQATEVPITGTVITNNFYSRLPHFDRIQNAPELFSQAHGAFGLFKRLRKVYPACMPDLMHWTYPLPLYVPGIPNIYTIHDLVPLRLPFTTLDNKQHYYRLVSAIARTADHIVTVSESSKRDIMGLLGIPEERITNTYQAVSIPDCYAKKSDNDVQREIEGIFGLGFKGYFLFWGAIEPKKNLGRLVEAYLASGVRTPLVIAGTPAWMANDELRLLNALGATSERRIMQFDYVPFGLLVSLIKGAKAAVFPSLYEGFGLPVLEAMLLGTPVITTNISSLPEVAGDSAILVDPYNAQEIARAIRTLDADEARREALAALGRVQAAKFSAEAYRERLSHVYSQFV